MSRITNEFQFGERFREFEGFALTQGNLIFHRILMSRLWGLLNWADRHSLNSRDSFHSELLSLWILQEFKNSEGFLNVRNGIELASLSWELNNKTTFSIPPPPSAQVAPFIGYQNFLGAQNYRELPSSEETSYFFFGRSPNCFWASFSRSAPALTTITAFQRRHFGTTNFNRFPELYVIALRVGCVWLRTPLSHKRMLNVFFILVLWRA